MLWHLQEPTHPLQPADRGAESKQEPSTSLHSCALTRNQKYALNSPTAFKLPLDVKRKCWRKGVILPALLAVFDSHHAVVLGSCGPEMLCKQLLLCPCCGKCTPSAPHGCTLSRHGFRGHSAVWPLLCMCCRKQDPWKSYFSLQTPPCQGLFPAADLHCL